MVIMHACMNWNVVDICKAVVLASVMVLTYGKRNIVHDRF